MFKDFLEFMATPYPMVNNIFRNFFKLMIFLALVGAACVVGDIAVGTIADIVGTGIDAAVDEVNALIPAEAATEAEGTTDIPAAE